MEFESRSGVKYWFDNCVGISFPLTPYLEECLKNGSCDQEQGKGAYPEEDIRFSSMFLKKLEKIRLRSNAEPRKSMGLEDLKRYILREGLLQMTLCVTEDCNLACRYCVYSDAYEYSRNRSSEKMDFQTAKAALDDYFSLLREGRRYNPTRSPSIGFYGGEPLTNFDLIKKCVQYVDLAYPDSGVDYTVTTNGTLLDEEKSDFLMEHDFSIAISLDGPQEEHDRNRVYRNGNGTFKDVMKNVRRIMDSGYKKCHSIAVFDWKSDLFKLQDFFVREDVPRLSMTSLPSIYDGCRYYDQFLDEDFRKYSDMDDRAFEWYVKNMNSHHTVDSFFDQVYGIYASTTIFSVPALIDGESFLIPHTGACVPGRKIFVDTRGNYHACERINQTFPIGNVHSGLDFEKIKDILKDYLDHLDSCQKCDVSRLCGMCYCAFAEDGHFQCASQICGEKDYAHKMSLSRAFTLGENSPEFLETLTDQYYTWLSKVSATLGD